MKTAFYFIVTCLISTFAFFGALGAKDPKTCLTCLGIAFGAWALFAWHCISRSREQARKREQQQLFEEFMRRKLRDPRY